MKVIRALSDGLYARPQLLLGLTAFFWACNAIAGQLARGEITPIQHVTMRWFMVTALMWPFFGRQAIQALPVLRAHLWAVAGMAALGFTGFNILFYLASFNTSAVNIGILQGSVPVFVVLLAFILRGTRITALQGVGIALTLAGVALVATRGAPWLLLDIALNFGDLIMLAACLSYAAYAVLLQGRPPIPGAVFFTFMAMVAAVTSIPPLVWEMIVDAPPMPTWEGWLITLFVAIFAGALAQQFFMRGVDLIGPGRAGIFTNLVPIFAAGLAILILGETFAWYHGVALLLVLGGIAIVQRPAKS